MSMLIALTISIGLLAVLATFLCLGPLAAFNVQVWQLFIGWASFYHCGGKITGLKNTVVCMVFGTIVGALSVVLAGHLAALGSLAAPVAVGVGASVICLAAHIPALATIPASVYGFAAVAGLILLKGTPPLEAILPTIISIVLGVAFGWASEYIAGMLAKKTT
jgi:hypothetical protein